MSNNRTKLYESAAAPEATVVYGNARFTVLSPSVIRMEWAADGKFEDRPSLVFLNRRMPVPSYTSSIDSGRLLIQTANALLSYVPDGDGRFTADNLRVTYRSGKDAVEWSPGKENAGALPGTTRALDRWSGDHVVDPGPEMRFTANMEPIQPGLLSRDGWCLVDDSATCLFDGDDFDAAEGFDGRWPWPAARPDGERQDYYLFLYGHDYKTALYEYTALSGRIALPPRFAFGYWWTRYTVYSDQEIFELVEDFKQRQIPLSVFSVDLEWHKAFVDRFLKGELDQSGSPIGFGGASWNRLLFPEPEKFFGHMHENGIHVSLNLHLNHGVQPYEDRYKEMAAALGLDPNGQDYLPMDISSADYMKSFLKYLHHPVEREGNDFWWVDHITGDYTKFPGLQEMWLLNYIYYMNMASQNKRPLIYQRWGGLGSHRYPIQFSGDMYSSWESLDFQVRFTVQSANSCAAYWSHDLGGHYPGAVDAELYTRWLQFGMLSPIMRTHACKDPAAERRVWAFPEPYASAMRQTILDRTAMIPYLYSEARKSYDSGVAFMHPLYYDYPDDEAAYRHPGEYFFGENLIAAPVCAPVDPASGVAMKPLWVPPGEWYELSSGKTFVGPCEVELPCLLTSMPLLQRAGSVLPMQEPGDGADRSSLDGVILRIAPANAPVETQYFIYEDSGEGCEYERGDFARTPVDVRTDGGNITVRISPAEGGFPEMAKKRTYRIRLMRTLPASCVTVNGKTGCAVCRYNGAQLENDITVEGVDPSAVTVVEITCPTCSSELTQAFDGMAGALAMLRSAYSTVNAAWPGAYPSDPLVESMQTGRRIELCPDSAAREILGFSRIVEQARADIDSQSVDGDNILRIKSTGLPYSDEGGAKRIAQIEALLKKAQYQIGYAAGFLAR